MRIRRSARYYSKLFCILLAAVLLAAAALPSAVHALQNADAAESAQTETARPSVNGRLHVEGTQLVDESGEAVQLRGVSTHGLTWYPDFINGSLFGQLADDWNCSFIRLAMYSSQYCGGQKEENYRLMKQGIDSAVASDMYVLVDWHILEDNDPNINVDEAIGFFDRIAAEYADVPNLIFEICNEPNGENTSWNDVYVYSMQVIPVIRKHIPDAVIVVGTPNFDRNLGSSVLRPLPFDNVMYVLHFYAASHHEELMLELSSAVDAGLPVFISECGLSEASGDGRIDFESAAEWFRYLYDHKISYAVWSLSNKNETSAFFRPGFDPFGQIRDRDLTASGRWVRELIRGKEVWKIPAEQTVVEKSFLLRISSWVSSSLGRRGYQAVRNWWRITLASAAAVAVFLLGVLLYNRHAGRKIRSYNDLQRDTQRHTTAISGKRRSVIHVILVISSLLTLVYLSWRVIYSVPTAYGFPAVAANLILLAVELLGFLETLVLYRNLMGLRNYTLPEIPDEAYPDVDVFIATYNEPTELLRRTINGCVHMKYPDPSKVHIWICDDNRRPAMRQLAEEMGVGYFDRPDNRGAKAGNLNHALARTSAPYIVTFDADMIPRSDFLLKTIPYFVDAELCSMELPEEDRVHLGLLQTPQCFYDPDVFQHALYSEKRVPNEQDFFYRTIEPARTATNSVIYGGSNTVLSRRALEDIGGFYTESITEDFATGLLIEAQGYISLALPEPLASGQTPHTFRDHIKQRTRWGRGVIVTAKKLKIWSRKELTLEQKISYWSSVVYWYSPVKNFIYILSPLLFAVFALPVFECSWLELAVFWLPMFIMQDISLIISSNKTISQKWSGIYETSVMPHLLIPILKESVGISLTSFKVTEKTAPGAREKTDLRAMAPFLILALLSVVGIVRILFIFSRIHAVGLAVLLFWIIRNLYFLIMAVFLVDGRDSDTETVRVVDAVPVEVSTQEGTRYEGVTTRMTEHNVAVFLDEGSSLGVGAAVRIRIDNGDHRADLSGVVTGVVEARRSHARTQTIEILDFGQDRYEYWELLYDRIPTLPQTLYRDFGIISHLWQNIAHRVARTRR